MPTPPRRSGSPDDRRRPRAPRGGDSGAPSRGPSRGPSHGASRGPAGGPSRPAFGTGPNAQPAPRPQTPRISLPPEDRLPPPKTAREAASRALARQAARFPDLEPLSPRTDALDDRDAALAHAIYDAAVTRWLTLQYILDRCLDQPLIRVQPELQGVLLGGAAQLLFLDRIPAHAAIDESAELGRMMVREGAAGLVNAVLRKVAMVRGDTLDGPGPLIPDPDTIPIDGPVPAGGDGLTHTARRLKLLNITLPPDPLDRLAIATSHYPAMIRAWVDRQGGVEPAARLALHSLAHTPTVLNTSFAAEPLPANLVPHAVAGHHVFTGSRAELTSMLASRRDLWVQDTSSSVAIAELRLLKPRLILDVCAGQGTKTRQLAATFPNAQIVASDPDPARFRTLSAEFAGHERVRVTNFRSLTLDWHGKADLVVLDVPCSNTGVLARRAEARYRWGASQTERLTALQRQIVADALPLLTVSPRGKILYATCSIDRAENRDIIDWVVNWHRFRIEHEALRLPQGGPGESDTLYRDGSYSVLLS